MSPPLFRFARIAIDNNNLKTLLQEESIPKDSQMKEVIDEVDSTELEPVLEEFFMLIPRG